MVVLSPLGWDPLPVPPRRRWPVVAAAFFLAALLLAGSIFVRLPYFAIAPGSAIAVNGLIEVPAEQRFPPRGALLLTTVALSDHVGPLEAVVGWLDPDVDVVPERQILGDTPRSQLDRLNRLLIEDSEDTAIVVALRALGHPVTEHGRGALVVGIEPGRPAEGRLEPGDTIVAIEGRPVEVAQQAIEILRARRPGDAVRIEVDRDGQQRRQEVFELEARNDGTPVLGVSLSTRERRFDLPFAVKINPGRIGGPSAGLAFTLGVLDQLTPGELTGGARVAVTGTIEIDGRVGEVGGVGQKTAAVRRAGIGVFLVPPGEFEVARAHAGKNLQVMKVANLSEALDVLGRLGGDVGPVRAAAGSAPRS